MSTSNIDQVSLSDEIICCCGVHERRLRKLKGMFLKCARDLTAAEQFNEAYAIMLSLSYLWMSILLATTVDASTLQPSDGRAHDVMESLWSIKEALHKLRKEHDSGWCQHNETSCRMASISDTWLSTLESLDLGADAACRTHEVEPRIRPRIYLPSDQWMGGLVQAEIDCSRATRDDKHIPGGHIEGSANGIPTQRWMAITSPPYDSSDFWSSSDFITQRLSPHGSELAHSMSCEPSYFDFTCRL